MKTTIELPDELLKKAKATAAMRGESLKDFISSALETRLALTTQSLSGRGGWRSVFGLADSRTVERVDRLIADDLEQVDLSEWR